MSTSVRNRVYISRKDRITRNENNLVNWYPETGDPVCGLEPRRLFPVSSPDSYISLLNADGAEIAVIRSMADLDAASRAVVEHSLADYYLVPTVTAILSASEKYGTLHWQVETDRGIKTIDIRNRNHDIRVYPDGCVRIRDWDDNRYIIPDYRQLDKHSRHFLIADL